MFNGQERPLVWNSELLCRLSSLAISNLDRRHLKCFIDALDECDAQQVQDMVYFFEELRQVALKNRVRLSICFASRHYPTIDIRRCQRLTLEHEEGHIEDLVKYIRNHLRTGQEPYIDEIRKQVLEKASGIFMWVVLVVKILNKEYISGRLFAVKQKLQETPAKLNDLFKDILRRDRDNMSDLLLCLQWILFAKRPLTREEFYSAMVAGLNPGCDMTYEQDVGHVTADDIGRFVLSSSKGLAELTEFQTPTVQFIHESVREFLVKENGLCDIWPELRHGAYSLSHDRLKQCCQEYLDVNLPVFTPPNTNPNSSSEIKNDLRASLATRFPFLEYAHGHVLYHADEAAVEIPQPDFLEHWDVSTWIQIGNLFENETTYHHTSNASALYLLAEHGYARLIKTFCGNEPMMGSQGERYHYPLFAALAHRKWQAIRALLSEDGSAAKQRHDRLIPYVPWQRWGIRMDHTPLFWALEMKHSALAEGIATCIDIDFALRNKRGRNALSFAAENGYTTLVNLLVVTHGLSVNHSDDSRHKAPLSYAAQLGHTKTVQQLLELDANIEAIDDSGWTALSWAAMNGHQATIQLLLDKGANVEAVDNAGETALYRVAISGHEAAMELLLEKGADVQAINNAGETALHRAAASGRDATVQLLLDRGASIQAANKNGETALHRAAGHGHGTTAQLLISMSADIEVRDEEGMTPFSRALENGHERLASLFPAENFHFEPGGWINRPIPR